MNVTFVSGGSMIYGIRTSEHYHLYVIMALSLSN
jgi:hypothetical protein